MGHTQFWFSYGVQDLNENENYKLLTTIDINIPATTGSMLNILELRRDLTLIKFSKVSSSPILR